MIIHPIFFYLMNAFHAADVVAILVAIGSSIVTLIMAIIWVFALSEEVEEDIMRIVTKYIKACIRVLCWALIATILIPSEDTMLMMLAASLATTDNVNAVFDALKAAIDYAITILQ